ncbi:MAG: TonB-dependent receptor [Lysobacter sp.]|nr:TonB-dependent receptor [Lysobacter sp.]
MSRTSDSRRRVPSRLRPHALAWAVCLLLAPPVVAYAQDPASPPADAQAASDEGVDLDAIVITATAGGKSKLRTSVSTSSLGIDTLERSAPRSTAEIFRNIPGIRSESTGGEGNANIAVRGLPVAAGGAKFLQLQEDGMPVMEFGDIAFGNADIFLRNDWSIERIEAVRGGSASTFASNSPGGVINFISNTGDMQSGAIGLTAGLDYDSFRTDFRYGMPFGDGWRFHVAGFYRSGDGVRDAGYTAEQGGQLKANLTKDFENGYLRFHLKRLDDRAIGYLPVPTRATGSNGSPNLGAIEGFDPARDTLQSRYFRTDIGLDGDNRRRSTDITDGMHPDSTAFGFEGEFRFGDGWRINEKFRYADNEGRFVGQFPAEVASAASIASSIGGAGATLRYANGPNAGQAFTGTAVRTHLFNTEINDFGHYANDLKATKSFALGGDADKLDVSLGWYRSRQNIDMDWLWNSYVQELRGDGQSALLNVFDAANANLSRNGLYAYGVPFWGNCCTRSYNTQYTIDAPYLSLSLSYGNWDIDASVRRDSGDADGNYAGSVQVANVDVDGDGNITAPELSVSQINNAANSPVNYDWGYTSYSVGANYLVNDDLGVFARISRGGRANADRLLFGLVQPDGSVRAQDAVDLVDQFEAGLKWRRENFSLFATAFFADTEEQNFELTSQRFFDRVYKARGIELEASWRYEGLFLNGGLTWTDAEISKDDISPANEGNTPRRQADLVYQLTGGYQAGNWTVGANLIGTTDAYAQDNNELVMPGYTQVNLFGDYRFAENWVVGLNVNNLFDAFGITESEEGSIVANTQNIIRARSIPGRTATVSVRFEF